jgi:ribosome-binding protein aMBF1 (putative translation factor)
MGKRGKLFAPARTAIPVVQDLCAIIDREARNLSQRSLTKRAGVDFNRLGEWRRGQAAPNMNTFSSVAAALGYRLALVPLEPAE